MLPLYFVFDIDSNLMYCIQISIFTYEYYTSKFRSEPYIQKCIVSIKTENFHEIITYILLIYYSLDINLESIARKLYELLSSENRRI